MDALRNPYTPAQGPSPRRSPAATISSRISSWSASGRLERGKPERGGTCPIPGLRGVGKTVLLTNPPEGPLALERGWFPASGEIPPTTPRACAPSWRELARRVLLSMSRVERIKDRARRALGVLKAFTVESPDGFELSLDVEWPWTGVPRTQAISRIDLGRSPSWNWVKRRTRRARASSSCSTRYSVSRPSEPGGLDCRTASCAAQRGLPLALVGGGLPSIFGSRLAGEAKSYAERLFAFPRIGSSSVEAAIEALVLPGARGCQRSTMPSSSS